MYYRTVQVSLSRRLLMLGTVAVWLVSARDKRDVLMLGAFLLLTGLAALVWNLVP
jgi:type II secretory pathway component PulM